MTEKWLHTYDLAFEVQDRVPVDFQKALRIVHNASNQGIICLWGESAIATVDSLMTFIDNGVSKGATIETMLNAIVARGVAINGSTRYLKFKGGKGSAFYTPHNRKNCFGRFA